MGETNAALCGYMNRRDRIRSVLEYYLGEKLPEDWAWEEIRGFCPIRNSKGKRTYRQRDFMGKVCIGGKHLTFRKSQDGQEEADMCKALDEICKNAEKKGMKQGIKQGRKAGLQDGINKMNKLILQLLADGRQEELAQAAAASALRRKLFAEYHI